MKAFKLSTHRSCALVAIIVLLGMSALTASAQSTTGSIYGTVTDASGAVIPNASVTVTDMGTGISHPASSDSAGNYVFPALNPGNYNVTGKAPGFKSETTQGIAIEANQNVHVNVTLSPGAVTQSITVTAATTLVDTRESQLAETVGHERIEDLPLNGRNVYDLLTLVPGVSNYNADTSIGSRGGVTVSVNGLPINSASYYLDGTSDTAFYQNGGNIMPYPDSLQEFRILTSNFDAEFGRSPGAVINAITRSGTKNFHGIAYEYLRNNMFNAKNYFLTSVTPLKQNQFGANVGGPLLSKHRAFFFGSYEELLEHTPVVIGSTAIVTATALERRGNFSEYLPTTSGSITSCTQKLSNADTAAGDFIVCNPTTAKPYAGNVITDPLDPVAQNLLKFVPVYNAMTRSTTEQDLNGNQTARQGLGRVDYVLGPHQIEALFFNARGQQFAPNAGNNQILSYSGMVNSENVVNSTLVDTWTVSPNTLNTLRGFYSQNRYVIGDLYTNHFLPDLGSQAAPGSSFTAPPRFSISGYWTMGTPSSGPSDISQLSFGVIDTAYLTHGRHQIKLGGSYVWNKYAESGALQSNGQFAFTGAYTKNSLADFLLGKASSYLTTSGIRHRSHNYDPSLYVQDDWSVAQRLTLNLGLRWEVFAPFVGDPNLGTFRAGVQSTVFPIAPLGLLYEGDAGVAPGIFNAPYNDFAPRFGFAYDVSGNGKTSLRGGFGIFYLEASETDTGNLQQQPYSLSVTINDTPNLVTPYAPGTDPFPFTFNPAAPKFVSGAAIAAARPDGGTPGYVQEYNLTLEQQLSRQWGIRISYVGNEARKIAIQHDINQPTYDASCTTATCGGTAKINARRPYQPTPSTYTFGAINLTDPADNFRYNSLQATIHNQVGSRLNLRAYYVWSKALSYEIPVIAGRDLQYDFGPASTNRANSFAISALYRIPNVATLGAFGKQVLSGWQLNGLATMHSGAPFEVTSGNDTNFDGVTNDLMNIVANPYFAGKRTRQQKIYQWVNPASFAVPTGPYGNEQSRSLVGPGFKAANLSTFKFFPLYREAQLQLRAEAFNAFGNVNLNSPVTGVLPAAQNQIKSAGPPRILQFAAKILF